MKINFNLELHFFQVHQSEKKGELKAGEKLATNKVPLKEKERIFAPKITLGYQAHIIDAAQIR